MVERKKKAVRHGKKTSRKKGEERVHAMQTALRGGMEGEKTQWRKGS